jgi:hypothetical protein
LPKIMALSEWWRMNATSYVVPVEGIEPPLLAEHDFESCASTSSATRAILVEHDPIGKPATTFPGHALFSGA